MMTKKSMSRKMKLDKMMTRRKFMRRKMMIRMIKSSMEIVYRKEITHRRLLTPTHKNNTMY